jgi:hypothetical protein
MINSTTMNVARAGSHSRWFDAFALLAIAGSLWNWLNPAWLSPGRPRLVYVSPNGSDWFSTGSETSPVATITEALRRVGRSGTVRLLDGEYAERVHVRHGGVNGNPLVIEAANPGKAIVSWRSEARLPVASDWKEEGDGIHSADARWPVYWIRDGDRSLLHVPYGGVDHLRQLVTRPKSDSAFTNSEGRLFVFLKGKHPRDCRLETHREVPVPREWGVHKSSNLWIEADDVVIRGIAFDFGVGSAIRIRGADRVRVENCAFTAASHGIRVDGREARRLTVERCLYHNYPQGLWSTEWLDWKEMYACYSDNSLLKASGSIVRVSRCVAVHCADGVHVSPLSQGSVEESVVQGNWIGFTTDDGLELDGSARHLVVTSNLLLDCFVGISCSPVREGPVRIGENVCWNRGISGENAHLKWVFPARLGTETRNVEVKGNLFVGGTPSYWGPDVTMINTEVRDNLFATKKQAEVPWPMSVRASENEMVPIVSPDDLSPGPFARRLETTQDASRWRSLIESIRERPGPDWWNYGKSASTKEIAAFEIKLPERRR